MKQTAVDFMANELLYLDNEFDMNVIDKNEYQARRKQIIEQAKEMENSQRQKDFIAGNNAACMEHEDIEDYFKQYIKSE